MNSESAVAFPVAPWRSYGWNRAALPTFLTAPALVIPAIVATIRQRGARLAFLFRRMIFAFVSAAIYHSSDRRSHLDEEGRADPRRVSGRVRKRIGRLWIEIVEMPGEVR